VVAGAGTAGAAATARHARVIERTAALILMLRHLLARRSLAPGNGGPRRTRCLRRRPECGQRSPATKAALGQEAGETSLGQPISRLISKGCARFRGRPRRARVDTHASRG